MKAVILFMLVAILAEAVVDWAKDFAAADVKWQKAASLVACLILAFGLGADFFSMIEVPFSIPYVGIAFTALIASRGANYVQDLWDKITSWRREQGA